MFQPRNLTQIDIEYHILESSKQTFPQWKEKTPLPEPYYMSQTLPHNREKVFARSLNKIISELWRNEFLEEFQDPPVTRKDAYIIIAGQDLNRADLFQAAPYITMDTKISTKALLRLRTQHTDEIPTHNHLYYDEQTGKSEKTDYVDRKCPACAEHTYSPNQPLPPIGSETHLLMQCPHTPTNIMEPFIHNISKKLMSFRLPKWTDIPVNQQVSLALGSTPPITWKISNKKLRIMRHATLNHASLVALRLAQYAQTFD